MGKTARERWSLVGIGILLGFLLCNLAFAQEAAQGAADGEEDGGAQEIERRELAVLRGLQKVEADRRRQVRSMKAQAELLTAETEMLTAQASNCEAKKKAFESGAAVDLCKRDEEERNSAQDIGAAGALLAAQQALEETLLERIAALEREMEERELPAAAEQVLEAVPAMLPAAEPVAPPAPEVVEKKRWLVFADVSQAVVREEGRAGDIVYRVPFEAVVEEDGCVVTQVRKAGIGKGARLCRNDAEAFSWQARL